MDVLARMTPQEMLGPGLRALEHALHDGDAPLMANATPAGTLQHSQSAPVIGTCGVFSLSGWRLMSIWLFSLC